MPKIRVKPKPAATVEAPKALDFTSRGMALALADLAEERGMTVRDVAGFPDRLRAAGLPERPERWLIDLAHRLHRDQIEAVLFRAGGTTTMRPLLPPSTPEDRRAAQAVKTVAEADAKASAAEAERAKAAARTAQREEVSRTSAVTRREARAEAERAAAALPQLAVPKTKRVEI